MKKIYTASLAGFANHTSQTSYESTRKRDVIRWAKRQSKERNRHVYIRSWNGCDTEDLPTVYPPLSK